MIKKMNTMRIQILELEQKEIDGEDVRLEKEMLETDL
jgi:hypothetical protein